jgi:peroxin-16
MDSFKQVRSQLPAVNISHPSKWVGLYEDFITKNASSVGQVESALRSLTYIIPGKAPLEGRSGERWSG